MKILLIILASSFILIAANWYVPTNRYVPTNSNAPTNSAHPTNWYGYEPAAAGDGIDYDGLWGDVYTATWESYTTTWE